MAGRSSPDEARTALVSSSDAMNSALSARVASCHSDRICRVQARPQPGVVSSAPGPAPRAAASCRVLAAGDRGVVALPVFSSRSCCS